VRNSEGLGRRRKARDAFNDVERGRRERERRASRGRRRGREMRYMKEGEIAKREGCVRRDNYFVRERENA
jgi:hypothetical protein